MGVEAAVDLLFGESVQGEAEVGLCSGLLWWGVIGHLLCNGLVDHHF